MMATRSTTDRERRSDKTIEAFVLEDLGISATVDQVVETFREVRELTTATADSEAPHAEFSAQERDALERVGASFAPLPPGTPDPVERMRVAFSALLLDTLSVDEVARRLGRDVSRIRQRVRDRSLWALAGEGGARLPRVQFADDGSEIPGMGRLLQALPADLHPVAVLRWLTRPKPDLRLEDVPVSPRDWLLAGGQPDEAVALAEDLHVA